MQTGPISCDLCEREMEFLWKTCDSANHPWNYVRCKTCGLIRLNIGHSNPLWNEVAYADPYYGDGFSKFKGAIQSLREFSAWRRAREIHQLFGKPGRVLDVGCGEGLFLGYMKKLGWKVCGCEIGERAAARAEERLSQPIHRGDLETMPEPDLPWNVVMLWHVLEHLSNPMALLKDLSNRMDPNGLLVIAIPNASSWQARLFGSDWFHLDPPRHLFSMDLFHLNEMARRVGWKIIESHHFSLEYNPYGWAQSLLNRLGWKRDAMYEVLKNYHSLGKRKLFLRVLAWFLLGPSVIPAVLESLAKRGGTITVYLRKS